jgi:uncharacterized protein
MIEIFVDTHHFVSRINARDQWHKAALEMEEAIGYARLVTTETVVHEVLNYFADSSQQTRSKTALFVHRIIETRQVEIVWHSFKLFLAGLRLYESRLDKGYSLTDCVSMNIMRERGITDVLSHDNHFRQEGFITLL